MHIPAETLQALIWRQVALDQQNERFQRYQRQGDMESAHFVELPSEQQQTLLARQDIGDAVSAARQGDAAGTQRGIASALDRAIYGGAQLAKPARRPPLRRKRGR